MPKVLLVDDEPNIRWTMGELLKREGYETFTAPDFDSAISVVENNELDAAVVDIVMPRKSGIEFLQELEGREPYVPVIMITGEPNISQVPDIVRAGAYDFISKPVHKDVLIRTVSKAVEKKRLVEEKRRLEQQIKQHADDLELIVASRTRELVEAHNFLNTILDSSTEHAIIAMDLEGRVTLFNRGAELILGYKAQEALGRPGSELLGENFDSDWKQSLEGDRGKAELRRRDGSLFTASVTTTPILRSDGVLLGNLNIVKDLTAELHSEEHLRQMRERLAHNEKIAALGRMAAQVAHEVRNPLAGLRLYTLHLKNKVADKLPPGEMSLIEKIIDSINQLSDTTEQVLNFARPLALTRRLVDLNRIITEALPLLEPQLTARRIIVSLSLSKPDAYAMLDEAAMRSTLINLMLNSIQAMASGGKLSVSTGTADENIQLDVADTGCGMTEEQIENIFEPFYTTRSQGLGLGMSFVLKVIEQHDGSIFVESRPGEGTRIRITLPVEEKTADEARRANSGSR